MTTLIIKSGSEKKTLLLVKLAAELGLPVSANSFAELEVKAMVTGIGRKATDEELINYLNKETGTPVSLEIAFAKYLSRK
jgi:hypothetical protein